VLLAEQLIEKAPAVSDPIDALAQSGIVLTVSASEAGVPSRLERTYLGHAGALRH
jgi:hypothetical protein